MTLLLLPRTSQQFHFPPPHSQTSQESQSLDLVKPLAGWVASRPQLLGGGGGERRRVHSLLTSGRLLRYRDHGPPPRERTPTSNAFGHRALLLLGVTGGFQIFTQQGCVCKIVLTRYSVNLRGLGLFKILFWSWSRARGEIVKAFYAVKEH